MALLLFVCVLFWGAHKSLAPRARTLLGGSGQATLSFFAVGNLLFFFFSECPKFATSPNSGVKFLRGFVRSEKTIFRFIFSGCASFSWFFFSAARARAYPRWSVQSAIDWVSGLPPTTSGHDTIMNVVDRFSKRGMFIPGRKDMTADDLIFVFLREVVRLTGCPRQIVSDRDKLFESQAWKELDQRFKIEMHQTVANRPRGNGLAERSNRLILQRLRTNGIFGNNEWDVDLLFAVDQFNNLTSNSLRLSPFEIDEGGTPHFPLDFPRMTSHAREPSTVNDYMQRAERTFDSVRAMLAEERRRQMHVVLQMDLKWVDDGVCWCRNINIKGNLKLSGAAPTKFSRYWTRARMLNLTSLPPLMGCEFSIETA